MPDKKETPQARWNRENVRTFKVQVMRTTESDILEWLESQSNISGYIKALIRKDMEEQKNK